MGYYRSPPTPAPPVMVRAHFRDIRVVQYRAENEKLTEEVSRLRNEIERLRGDIAIEKGFKVSRDDVFSALDSERRHMVRIGYGPQEVGSYMLLMQHYLFKARDNWACSKKPPLDELDNIRKVGALVVACLEAHGAPPRVKSKTHPIPGQPKTHAPR